jgi:radical SAM protein with 4Fe4S-binding SPASM domain
MFDQNRNDQGLLARKGGATSRKLTGRLLHGFPARVLEALLRRLTGRRAFDRGYQRYRPFLIPTIRLLNGLGDLKDRNLDRMRGHAKRRDVDLLSLPKLIHVELSTICNLRCRMCSISRPSRTRELKYLEMDVVEKLEPALPYIKDCKLHGGGEPFLNPGIERILEVFQRHEVRLNTVTNGTVIDDRLGKLIGENFSTLTMSVDGATARTFELVRPPARFSSVLRSFEYLDKHRHPDFKLIIGVVIMNCNIRELPDLVRFTKEHGGQELQGAWLVPFHDLPWTHDQDPTIDPVLTNRCMAEARAVGEELGISVRLPPDLPSEGAAKNVDLSHKPSYHDLHGTNQVEGHCRLMYDRAMVMVDGRIKPCGQSETVEKMGSLFEKTFAEIWSGPEYQELRATFNGGTLPKTCRSCNFIRSGQLGDAKLVFPGDEVVKPAGTRSPTSCRV